MEKEVIYLGEMVRHFKIVQRFRDAKGEEYFFIGLKNLYFGSCYHIIDRTIKTRPESLDNPTLEQRPNDWQEYETNKILVRQFRLENRKRMDLKKVHPDVMQAVDLLRPFMNGLHKYDKQRFLDWVNYECTKPITVKKKRRVK